MKLHSNEWEIYSSRLGDQDTTSLFNKLMARLFENRDGPELREFDSDLSSNFNLLFVDRVLDKFYGSHEEIEERIKTMDGLTPLGVRERQLFELGMDFLDAVAHADIKAGEKYINSELDVNFAHPQTKRTALHFAVIFNNKAFIRLLDNSGKCDYLAQDKDGFYPFSYAEGEGCRSIKTLLLAKANLQAKQLGHEHVLEYIEKSADPL